MRSQTEDLTKVFLQQRQLYIPKKIAVAFFGLFVFNSLYSQMLNVQGNVFTDATPVKYASVTFIDTRLRS